MFGFSYLLKGNFHFLQMSLYLGNLSSHIRRDDLERVFWRFGRCNIQLKDGYGFAVYDFPANADKAMRAMRGKNICGERISLTWSNKQPRGFQRGARSYELQRGRISNRKLGSKSQRGYKVGVKKLDRDGYRSDAVEMLDEERSYNQDNIKDYGEENHHNAGENLSYEGGSIEPDAVDNDRWGQHVGNLSNGNGLENGMEFDRYEPYHGEDRSNEEDNIQMTYSGGSPTLRSTQEKTGREQIGDAILLPSNIPKPQLACYHCGRPGHKMRNCLQGNASQKKFSRFDLKRNDEINLRGSGGGELPRTGSKPHEKGHSGSRDTISLRWHTNDRKASGSGKYRRLIRSGSSAARKESHRAQGKEYGGKKQSRMETGTPKRHIKKARTSVSPPMPSDYTTSRSCSHSKSLKSIPGCSSPSRSRSVSSKHFLSSIPKSSSTSRNSRSGCAKSRRSSSPTSLSLSVSLGKPLLASPNKVERKLNGSSVDVTNPESKEVLAGQGQQVEGDAGSENSKQENTMAAVENENAVSFIKMEDDMNKNQPQQRDDHGNCIPLTSNELKNPCTEKGAFTPTILSPESLRETAELQNSGAWMMEHLLAPTKKPDSEAMAGSFAGNSTCISSEEVFKILKYYGLEHSEDNKMHLPVEDYFGSARLWPWEIIYYRRLKKGPISTENYDRRIAQNREFGIVDKYIRSSSGWGELVQDNV